jgi:hypothetical protein
MNDDVEVADGAAVATSAAAPFQLDALTIVDAGGDTHLYFACSTLDASSATGSTRRCDDRTGTATRGTR